jgi:phosphonate transport system substrate-binding protein
MRRPALTLCLFALTACGDAPFREARVNLDGPAPAEATASPLRAGPPTLRFSVAAVESPRDTYSAYSRLFDRMGRLLGVEIELVQRRTYREVNDLLVAGKLDAALVCTGGYLDLKRRAPGAVEVLAAPIADGKPTYESLVIVPVASRARTVADLAGRRFAFTDELSFSGRAYVLHVVGALGHDPERFFGSTMYTRSHDRSISAVVTGLADGAAVHGGVFAHHVSRDPELASRVRVIHRSPPFGAMPFVASTRLDPGLRARLRAVLLSLADDPEAAEALRLLDIERLEAPAPRLYESAERLTEARR